MPSQARRGARGRRRALGGVRAARRPRRDRRGRGARAVLQAGERAALPRPRRRARARAARGGRLRPGLGHAVARVLEPRPSQVGWSAWRPRPSASGAAVRRPSTSSTCGSELERGRGQPLFSRLLASLLNETLAAGEQAILFLNRRGFVPVMWCPGCKETAVGCDQCDVSPDLPPAHRRGIVCHGCCEERALPESPARPARARACASWGSAASASRPSSRSSALGRGCGAWTPTRCVGARTTRRRSAAFGAGTRSTCWSARR